ncbi:MAG TPA: hypothetical protein PK926_07930 [Spirochaetota bacterium]|nr:hypothetical protein [Spirochaetota bacterium]
MRHGFIVNIACAAVFSLVLLLCGAAAAESRAGQAAPEPAREPAAVGKTVPTEPQAPYPAGESAPAPEKADETAAPEEKQAIPEDSPQAPSDTPGTDEKAAADSDLGRSEPVTSEDKMGFKSYKIAVGIVVNAAAAGLHFEYRFIPYIGVKLMLFDVFGLALEEGSKFLDPGEFLITGLLAPTLHFPVKKNLLDPYLFCGMIYSHFHWIHSKSDKEGNIRDLTFGGGVGLGIRLTDFLDMGINIWCNYDYRVDWSDTRAAKGPRVVMVLPYFSIKFLS